jgi:cellulose synthase/poly-beta-1,6-N-acetylglucosamine synthase-like glycosyltransferase
MTAAILEVVSAILLGLFLFSQLRGLVMTVLGVRFAQREAPQPEPPLSWPSVVVQLPVYREENVLVQLVSAVLAMDYPADRLVIQVIDDSTGLAAEQSEAIVKDLARGSVRVEYIHREDRTGYKSGAMNHGARQLSSDLIAIFDADFVPAPGFLRAVAARFVVPRLAAVQTRWSYRNASASSLTILQAAVFETVFCFEVHVRSSLGLPAFFMGTAGVWRRSVIEELGGWREWPFTAEDLDLSYRALHAGWRIGYDHRPLASCEASESFLAFKNQQRRWARGIFQATLDNARGGLRMPHGARAFALDLTVLALQLAMPALTILLGLAVLWPVLDLPRTAASYATWTVLSVTLLVLPTAVQLIVSQRLLHPDWRRRALLILRAGPFAAGLSIAVLAGLWDVVCRSRTEFVRTPKQRGAPLVHGTLQGFVHAGLILAVVELALGVTGLVGFAFAVLRGYPESFVPAVVLGAGNLAAFTASAGELASHARRRDAHPPSEERPA